MSMNTGIAFGGTQKGDGAGTPAQPGTASTAQPSQNAAAQEPPANKGTPQFMTREEFEKAFEEKLNRSAQSFSDKFANRLESQIKAKQEEAKRGIEVSRKFGAQITPEQEAQYLRDAALEAIAQSKSDQAPAANAQATQPAPVSTPAPAQAQAGEPADPVTVLAQKMLSDMGVTITENDPEWALIDGATQDPLAFLQSVKAAGTKAAERMKSAPVSDKPKEAIYPSSGSAPVGNPIANVNNVDALYEMANKRRHS